MKNFFAFTKLLKPVNISIFLLFCFFLLPCIACKKKSLVSLPSRQETKIENHQDTPAIVNEEKSEELPELVEAEARWPGYGPYHSPNFSWHNTDDFIYKMLQIPPKVLSNISTDDLIVSCLNSPAICNFMLFSTKAAGFERMKSNYNGFREISHRKDAGILLLNIFHNLSVDPSKKGNIIYEDSGDSSLNGTRYCIFDSVIFLLCDDNVMLQFNIDEKYALLEEGLKKMNDKNSFEHMESLAFLLGNVLKELSYKPFLDEMSNNFVLHYFIEKETIINLEGINTIIKFAKECIF